MPLKSVNPLVSILINNYNYGRFLDAAIASALNQTYPHIEVIVVDDGSTDDSPAIIAGYGGARYCDRLILKANGGQASALNAGFAASQGDIICLLDADDLFLPTKVAEVVDLFQADVSWVFHESMPVQSTDIINTEFSTLVGQATQPATAPTPQHIDFRPNILKAQIPDFTPSTSNLCFSRALAARIFPLPELKGLSGAAINDFYIKYIAVGLETGCSSKKNLGLFRVHSSNAFSTQSFLRKRAVYAEMYLLTAYWMRINFPEFSKLSQKLFAKGLATYFKSKGAGLDYRKVIQGYFAIASYPEKLEVGWKSAYYFLKLGFTNLV
jgi:glycosyltransferase involved in cell wall biosynthesis